MTAESIPAPADAPATAGSEAARVVENSNTGKEDDQSDVRAKQFQEQEGKGGSNEVDHTPTEQNDTAGSASAQGPSEQNGESKPKSGTKRDHADTVTPTENQAKETTDPPSKKQKSGKEAAPAGDEPAATEPPTINGEKKRRGRPKKGAVKSVVAKKPRPAPGPRSEDGIGSRTRSRLKIS